MARSSVRAPRKSYGYRERAAASQSKRRYGRKWRNRNAPSTMSRARALRVLQYRTAGLLGIEKKFYDSFRTTFTLPAPSDCGGGEATPSVGDCLNCPAQGDGESQRDGRQISMDSINIKGVVDINDATTGANASSLPDIFIALILDQQTNGVRYDSEDVFVNPGGITQCATQPFVDLSRTKRFRVLKVVHIKSCEWAGNVQPNTDAGGSDERQGATIGFSIYQKLGGMKVNFTGTTSDIANIADNSLHLCAYASDASMVPLLRYNSRLRFMG